MTALRITAANAKTDGNIHYRALLDNETLGQWDLPPGKQATVVIESIEPYFPRKRRQIKKPDGSVGPEPIKRLLVRFVGKRKAWISGPATQQVIAKMHGRSVGDWIGKKITLYNDPGVTFGREITGGIRVRNTAPQEAPTDDPLDRDVDLAAAERIAAAKEFLDEGSREPGVD